MNFSDRLSQEILHKRSRLMVGLDPILNLLPPEMLDQKDAGKGHDEVAEAVARFLIEILDAVADLAVAVKPQMAFFERLGAPGILALEAVVAAAKSRGLLVVCDCKRGDIGSTAVAYADRYLGDDPNALGPGLGSDAVTVSPYLGVDSLEPFASYIPSGRGIFVLAKTSNAGSSDLQDRLILDGDAPRPVYQVVSSLAQSLADRYPIGEFGYHSVGLVVGATFPAQAIELRQLFPQLPFLIPGIGAQGAQAADVRGCFDSRGLGAIINSSRGILFAYRTSRDAPHWKDAARTAAEALKAEINSSLDVD